MLTTLLLPKASAAPLGKVSLSLPLHWREKRTWRDNQSSPSTVGHFVGLQWNLWGSTTGNLTVTKKGGGAGNNQHMNLGKPSSCLQCPGSESNLWLCSSAEPRQGCTLTREIDGMQICLALILKQ